MWKKVGLFFIGLLSAAAPRAEEIDLFILAGQSNAQGWQGDARFYPGDPGGLDGAIRFYWNTPGISSSKGAWTTLRAQGGRFAAGHFGPEVSFLRELKKAGLNPALFKYTLGGTGIARDWRGPGGGGMYDRMKKEFAAAAALLKKQGHTVHVRGFVWIQGESDAQTPATAAAYKERLRTMIGDVRENMTGRRKLPVILGVDERHPFVVKNPAVVAAQRELAENDPFIAYTSMIGLQKADSTHLTPQGLEGHGKRIFAAYAALAGPAAAAAPLLRPSAAPTALHRQMIERRYGLFICFGINTFHDREWTDGTLPAASYAPAKIDTDNWAKTAKDAGMKYVLLIAKHHDGFCLWDSKYTEYDVASSPNKTDVVAAMAGSCRKYGIRLGLYYSLWDRNWGGGVMRGRRGVKRMDDKTADAYAAYMAGQFTELLTQYGPVCELWLDGGWIQPRGVWRIPKLYALVKRHQPGCAMGVNWSIGLPGNPDAHGILPKNQKRGYPIRYFPSDFRLGDPCLPGDPDPKLFSHDGKLYYMPFETTICLNDRWFFNTGDRGLKSVGQLADVYKKATSQDNILLLNSPPNREGVMPEGNVRRLKELAAHLGLAAPAAAR